VPVTRARLEARSDLELILLKMVCMPPS
jgi:hypothetical protein